MEREDYVIKLKKPFQFEGEEHKEIDLNGLENLTGSQLLAAEKRYNASGAVSIMPEMTTGYAFIIAGMASGKPVEFFEAMPAKYALTVKNVVLNFLNASG